jgi:hypothetical protein
MTRTFDAIELEVLWQSLIATVNEQAQVRCSVRRSRRSCARRATWRTRSSTVAAAWSRRPSPARPVTSTASLAPRRRSSRSTRTDTLSEGDVLITNDPYKTAGQLLDVTVLYPVFRNGRVIAFFGSTIHHTDVGGYGIGAGARDVFEEGIWIPICKLMIAGERNHDAWKFILSNVRQPDHMAGDLHAQMASGEVGAQRLRALCDRHGLDDIEDLADEIISRSEAATRASIRELPAGTYSASARARPRRRQQDRHRLRGHGRSRGRRDHRRLRGLVGRQPVRHQRRQELHARVHHVHGALGAQPRAAQQPRQPGADQGRGPGRFDRQRGVAAAVHRPSRGRHVPAQRAVEGARPDPSRAGDGRGLRCRVDDAGQRQPRRRSPVHHRDVHLRRWRRRPRGEAGARRVLVPDGRRRGADRGGRGIGPDPVPPQGTAARQRRLGPPDRRPRPDDRIHRRHRSPVAAQRRHLAPRRRPAGHLRWCTRRGRRLHGQRRTRAHPGTRHAAAGRPGAARSARRRRLRRARRHHDPVTVHPVPHEVPA